MTLLTNAGGVYSEGIDTLDLLNYNYTRPSNNPTAPGNTFSPNVGNYSIPNGSPIISMVTFQCQADRSVVLEGANFTSYAGSDAGKDTTVYIYAQTGSTDATLIRAQILRVTSNSITCTIPSALPYGVYAVWVRNYYGIGNPVLVNNTQATWVGPRHGVVGASVSVYGRNLSNNNGTSTSYVYIRPWGASSGTSSTTCTVTAVNPFKVTFTIPSVTSGDYEVWIHNGHGGDWGWSGPMKLTVESANPYAWNGTTRNVKTGYGAKGDGSTDDKAAIQAAISAASNGDTIYFPTGHYMVSSWNDQYNEGFIVNKSLQFTGDGASSSIIETMTGDWMSRSLFSIRAFPTRIYGLTFKSTSTQYLGYNIVNVTGYGLSNKPNGVIVDHCAFQTNDNAHYAGLWVQWANDIYITNNTFTGLAFRGSESSQSFANNNIFYGTTGSDSSPVTCGFGQSSCQYDFTTNSAGPVDYANNKGIPRFFVSGAGADCGYVGNNTANRCGYTANCGDANGGEQVLFECATSTFQGLPTSVGSNPPTLTFSGTSWATNSLVTDYSSGLGTNTLLYVAVICKGTGAGQWRKIISNTSTTITLDRPWEIQPDTSSRILIIIPARRCNVYNNVLDGIYDLNPVDTSNTGISFYDACIDNVAASNTITHMKVGVAVTPTFYWSGGVVQLTCPTYNNVIAGNSIATTKYGIDDTSATISIPAPYSDWGVFGLNTVYRDNTINLTGGSTAVIIDRASASYFNDNPWIQNSLLENTTITNVGSGAIAVQLAKEHGYTILRNNSISGSAGSLGISFDSADYWPMLYNNTYSGIGTVYTGSLPGSGQQVNTRGIFFTAASNTQVSQTVGLRNVGTSSLTVSSIASDQTWLTAILSPTTISDETGTSTLTITCDSTGLSSGTYLGTLTVNGGTQYNPEKLLVVLTVP